MTVYNNFILNSEYPFEKQEVGSYEIQVSVPARTLNGEWASYEYTKDIAIPEGKFFEVVSLNTTLDSGVWYPGANANVKVANDEYSAITAGISCGKVSSNTVRLAARVFIWWADHIQIPAYTVTAKIRLTVSPFDK